MMTSPCCRWSIGAPAVTGGCAGLIDRSLDSSPPEEQTAAEGQSHRSAPPDVWSELQQSPTKHNKQLNLDVCSTRP